jgi:hypothetical protein
MNPISVVRLMLLALYLVLVPPLGLFATWFLFRAQTWTGVGLAVLAILGVLLPVPVALWWSQPTQRPLWGWSGLVIALVVTSLVGLILWSTPDGVPPPGSPVLHCFTRPVTFPRYTIANIVPEIEQFNLGLVVMPYLDRRFTTERARRVAPFTLALYQEMESDPNFHQLGSDTKENFEKYLKSAVVQRIGAELIPLLGAPPAFKHYEATILEEGG